MRIGKAGGGGPIHSAARSCMHSCSSSGWRPVVAGGLIEWLPGPTESVNGKANLQRDGTSRQPAATAQPPPPMHPTLNSLTPIIAITVAGCTIISSSSSSVKSSSSDKLQLVSCWLSGKRKLHANSAHRETWMIKASSFSYRKSLLFCLTCFADFT